MTRYEIALGIAPPPEPPFVPEPYKPPVEYVMGVDLGTRSDTVCCICHEENGCMHVDQIDRVAPGIDSYSEYRSTNWPSARRLTDDDVASRNREEIRHRFISKLLSKKVTFSDDCTSRWQNVVPHLPDRMAELLFATGQVIGFRGLDLFEVFFLVGSIGRQGFGGFDPCGADELGREKVPSREFQSRH